MTTCFWILELGRTSWTVRADREDGAVLVAADEFAESELALQAELIQSALAADGYQGEAIVLALESSCCLSASLPIGRPQELRDRPTMHYRLEEWIPWSAEEFVADFRASGDRALAVAVPVAPLTEFVDGLAKLAIHIECIVPLALLLAAAHAERTKLAAQHVVGFQRNGWIDLVQMEQALPINWTWLPADRTSLGYELDQLSLQIGVPACWIGYNLDPTLTDQLRQRGAMVPADTSIDTTVSTSELALSAVKEILQGRREAPVDLKHGRFGRKQGHVALRPYAATLQAALAILFVATMFALVYRGHADGRQAELVAAQQVEVFRAGFPNTKVPVGIRSRLKSELAKLNGLQGDENVLPTNESATVILHHLLSSLPTDRRFRLLEIRIEDGRVYLDGEARTHGDAEAIAQRLRTGGFEISPPRSQRLDGERVSLRITGTLSTTGTSVERKAI